MPRFSDLYALVRGRAVLTVGFKVDLVSRLADWIHAHGSFDDVIFFVKTGEQMQAAARAKGRYPEMMVMVRLLDTRVTVESTKAVFGRLPEILHTDHLGAKQVSDLQAQGVKVFMNVLRAERLTPPLNSLAIWWVLSTRPDFVQTDEPVRLMHRVATNGR